MALVVMSPVRFQGIQNADGFIDYFMGITNADTGEHYGGIGWNTEYSPDGTFAVALPAGNYVIDADADGHGREFYDNTGSWFHATRISVTEGNTVQNVDFSLVGGLDRPFLFEPNIQAPIDAAETITLQWRETENTVGYEVDVYDPYTRIVGTGVPQSSCVDHICFVGGDHQRGSRELHCLDA